MFKKCLGFEIDFLKWLFKIFENSFWESNEKYIRYRTTQRMTSISKLVFWQIFGGNQGDTRPRKKSVEAILSIKNWKFEIQ